MDIKLAIAISILSLIMGLKEGYELLSVPTIGYYFTKLENLGQLLLIVLVALTTLPIWTYLVQREEHVIIRPWQYQAAAVCLSGIFHASVE